MMWGRRGVGGEDNCALQGYWHMGTASHVASGAGGVTALMHACSGSPAELQIATLTVLRQLVVQPAGPEAFLVARAIPLLAMLQHSLVAEIRILATKILERVSASSGDAEEAIAQEQHVQVWLMTLHQPYCFVVLRCSALLCGMLHVLCTIARA